MNTGKTQNLAVIGCPVAHSLSPAMQSAAIAAANVDFAYIALKVLPEDLPAAVNGLKATNFRGFNVTIPHKQTIIPLLDNVDDDARKIGAVNTVINDGGKLKGYNTDADGFLASLAAANFSVRGKTAAIFGAGGAARAVLHALMKSGATRVAVGARDGAKAAALAKQFAAAPKCFGCQWTEADFLAAVQGADLIVNATPLGMTGNENAAPPIDWANVNKTALICDLIYTPAETKFLREGASHGHQTINGEPMLAAQGAAAFKLWTGHDADTEAMKKILRKCLNQ